MTPTPIPDEGAREAFDNLIALFDTPDPGSPPITRAQRTSWQKIAPKTWRDVSTACVDQLTTELAEARRERDEQRERKQVARDAFQVAVKDALDLRAQLARANAVIERVGAYVSTLNPNVALAETTIAELRTILEGNGA